MRPIWSLVAAAVLIAGPAMAEDAADPGGGFFGWSVAAAVRMRVQPDYQGSNDYRVVPAGSLAIFRSGGRPEFGAPDDSPSLGLFGNDRFSAGLVANWRGARDDKRDLQGFDKVDWAIEPGVFANWWVGEGLRLHGEVRKGVNGNSAWMADVSADAVYRGGPWVLSIGPRAHWADSDFTRTYFSVSAADAARSPFHIGPYAADGDFSSAGVLASAEYRWAPRWSVQGEAGYLRLMGAAAGSPIVSTLGSKDQFEAALGVRYVLIR
ncbi:MAG: MipA/OmpV family protein [Phenylobacterium sp.]|nr:MAG: MipA/OmpV family protein [Phenylobacterium sp.]